MNTVGLRSLLFGAGYWLGGVIAAAIDTYLFDHFEAKWGRGWSLQVTAYLLVLFALAAAVLFGIGQVWLARPFALRSARFRSRTAVVAVAAVFASLFVVLGNTLVRFVDEESIAHPIALWVFFILGALVLGGPLSSGPQTASSAAVGAPK